VSIALDGDDSRCMPLRWPMNSANPMGATPAARVAAHVICQYVNVEGVALGGLYLVAEAKLATAREATYACDDCHRCPLAAKI
jgi:hypothetical protein